MPLYIFQTAPFDRYCRRVVCLTLHLVDVPVYVPSFYEITYGEDGTITGKKPLEPTAPEVVYKRAEQDLDALDFPTHPIVPYSDTVHDRIMLELFRGCSRGCRFCNAGIIYRPVRERRPGTVLELAKKLLSP